MKKEKKSAGKMDSGQSIVSSNIIDRRKINNLSGRIIFLSALLILFIRWTNIQFPPTEVDLLSNRLETIKRHLPPSASIGFYTDVSSTGEKTTLHFQSAFVLAPAILNPDKADADTMLLITTYFPADKYAAYETVSSAKDDKYTYSLIIKRR